MVFNPRRTESVTSAFDSRRLSVSSSSRYSGARPVSRSTLSISLLKFSWRNCTADTFTATGTAGSPSSCHFRVCEQAVLSTHSPMGMIRPLFSAIRMNLSGWHEAQLRVLPAEERLQPDDPSSGNFYLRLIHQKEFLLVECQSQAVLQGQSLHSLSVHVFCKEPKVVTSALFGAIHGCIGILDQGFAVRTVFRENADAEAAINHQWVTLDDEFSGHCIHEPLSGNCCAGDLLYRSQHNE